MLESLTRISKSIWEPLWGKFSVLAAGMLLTWIVSVVPAAYARASAIYHMPEKLENAQAIGEKLDKVISQIERLDYRSRTLTGTASVGDFDGESIVQINILGEAADDYEKAEKMRVTNLSSPDSPSIVVKIEGSFRTDNRTHLIRLSRTAASKLDIRGSAKVRIEPVEVK